MSRVPRIGWVSFNIPGSMVPEAYSGKASPASKNLMFAALAEDQTTERISLWAMARSLGTFICSWRGEIASWQRAVAARLPRVPESPQDDAASTGCISIVGPQKPVIVHPCFSKRAGDLPLAPVMAELLLMRCAGSSSCGFAVSSSLFSRDERLIPRETFMNKSAKFAVYGSWIAASTFAAACPAGGSDPASSAGPAAAETVLAHASALTQAPANVGATTL